MATTRTYYPDAEQHARRYRPWPRSWVVAGVVLLVVGIGAGLALQSLGAGRTGELGLAELIARERPRTLVNVAVGADALLSPGVAAVLLATVCAGLWALHSLRVAVAFGALTCAGWFSAVLGKLLVDRPHPPASLHPITVLTDADGYPSSHMSFAVAALAAAAAVTWLTCRDCRWVLACGLPLALAVGSLRLVAGTRYLGDVLGGAVLAFGAVLLVAGLWRTGGLPGRTGAARTRGRVARGRRPERTPHDSAV